MDDLFLTVSQIGARLFRPDHLVIMLLVGAYAAIYMGKRWGLSLLRLLVILGLVLTVFPLGEWLLAPLQDRYGQPDLDRVHANGVIVLGGAESIKGSYILGTPQLNRHSERLLTFMAVGDRLAGIPLIFSGGSTADEVDKFNSSAVAEQLFRELSWSQRGRVVYEDQSRSTFENAHFTRGLIEQHGWPTEQWLLVTSAFHMPRAVEVFRKQGISVIPYSVDYQFPPYRSSFIEFDLFRNLDMLQLAWHEWLGILVYRLTGRC